MRIHQQAERLVAEFLRVDDAIIFGMGFATNSLNLPTLLGPRCLVFSDEYNHASIILGIKISGSTVKVSAANKWLGVVKLLQDIRMANLNRYVENWDRTTHN